jgi:hypothetical protein
MRTPINFDDETKLLPIAPEVLASLTERQRKAFARYAVAHEGVRKAELSPEQRELMEALARLNAADDEAWESTQ